MPTCEKQNVVRDRAHSVDDPVGAYANLLGAFSSRAPVAKQIPVRSLRTNVRTSTAFVVAVAPLNQVGIDLGYQTKPCQFACLARALQRAGEYLCES